MSVHQSKVFNGFKNYGQAFRINRLPIKMISLACLAKNKIVLEFSREIVVMRPNLLKASPFLHMLMM